jgi:hypothetical protein
VKPRATRLSISDSRGDSASLADATATGCGGGRDCQRTSNWRAMIGDIGEPRACRLSTCAARSPPVSSFSRQPLAPASNALSMLASSPNIVMTIIAQAGCMRRQRRITSRPEQSGRPRSTSSSSTALSANQPSSSVAVDAPKAKRKVGSAAMTRAKRARMPASSSTRATLIGGRGVMVGKPAVAALERGACSHDPRCGMHRPPPPQLGMRARPRVAMVAHRADRHDP